MRSGHLLCPGGRHRQPAQGCSQDLLSRVARLAPLHSADSEGAQGRDQLRLAQQDPARDPSIPYRASLSERFSFSSSGALS